MKQGIVVAIGGVTALVALGLMNLTTPDMVGPLGVLAFFVCTYIAIVCGLYLLLLTGVKSAQTIVRSGKLHARLEQVSIWKL